MRKRSENVIPDYDYLFRESVNGKGVKKNKFLSKIIKINIAPIILSSLVYILQSSPLYIVPLATSDIINVVTGSDLRHVATDYNRFGDNAGVYTYEYSYDDFALAYSK